jgi:hypothetical protein
MTPPVTDLMSASTSLLNTDNANKMNPGWAFSRALTPEVKVPVQEDLQ